MNIRHGLLAICSTLAGVVMLATAGCNKPAETTATTVPAAPAPSVAMDNSDSNVSAAVKLALLADPGIKIADLQVDTLKGTVQLSGTTDDQAQLDRAGTVARGVTGVTGIDNKLSIKK